MRAVRKGVLIAIFFLPLIAVAVHHVLTYAWMCDDAYISFRYVRNFKDGLGLVFNRGERVEGYTNFLWCIELAAIWKLFGIAPEDSANALSCAYTLPSVGLALVLAWRTAFAELRWVAAWCVMALLAASRTWAVWATGGLETRQFTFFVLAAVVLITGPTRGPRRLALASLMLAGAELTRPEGILIYAVCAAWLLADDLWNDRVKPGEVAAFVLPFALVIGAHFLFRWSYYGDLFPNTYYAKHVRSWPEAGFQYFTLIASQCGLLELVALAAIGALARTDSNGALLLSLVGVHAAYVFRIGGDHFEFRPLDFYWPLLFPLAVDGLFAIGRAAGNAMRAVVVLGFLGVLFTSNILQYAHYCLTYELTTRDETFKLAAPITPENFPAAWLVPGIPRRVEMYNAAARYCAAHSIAVPHAEHKAFWKHQVQVWGPYTAAAGRMNLPDSAITMDVAIGVTSYSLADLPVVDCQGLTDAHVAHQEVHTPNRLRTMAHDRHATAEYLFQRGINLIPCPPAGSLHDALSIGQYALKLAPDLWMPFNSQYTDWVKREFSSREAFEYPRMGAIGAIDKGAGVGWTFTGDAMTDQPARGARGPQMRVDGNGGRPLINSFHPGLRDGATGTALSPTFVAPANAALRLRVGGGAMKEVGVTVLADGQPIKTWHGANSPALELVTLDLAPFLGKSMQIRVFDDTTAGWGHILASDFELVLKTPRRIR